MIASQLHRKQNLFTLFKYSVYLLLTWNCILFFQQDWAASNHIFQKGVQWSDLAEAFAQTIDTVAWVVLLLSFELTTYILSDVTLKKNPVKWGLIALRVICYSTILYAFYGYCYKFNMFWNVSLLPLAEPCVDLIKGAYSMVDSLDEYRLITTQNCTIFMSQDIYQITGQALVATPDALLVSQRLAFVDVLNSGVWIMVVVILEIDVWFQLKGLYKGILLGVSKWIKIILYSTLLLCAIFWGMMDGFLDFWDAFLWLVAFFFIEMNLFQWQKEEN